MAANSGFPANFTSRRELQSTVVRCNSLLQQTEDKPLRRSLYEMAVAAATLDALLVERKEELLRDVRYARVYDGEDWEYTWADSKCCMHTGRGLFFLSVGQQCMIMDGQRRLWVGCQRFRLQLGDTGGVYRFGASLRELTPYVSEYLDRFGESLPQSREAILELFMDDDIPEVRQHAAVCGAA